MTSGGPAAWLTGRKAGKVRSSSSSQAPLSDNKYVLRPLLAIRWIERDLGPVPVEFQKLVESTVDAVDLKAEIERLVAAKRDGAELDYGPRIESISAFIEQELDHLEETSVDYAVSAPQIDPLNRLFRTALDEVWGKDDSAFGSQ